MPRVCVSYERGTPVPESAGAESVRTVRERKIEKERERERESEGERERERQIE